MKKLLNTLFITQPDVYLSLDGDNIVLLKDQEKLGRLPLHNLESIVSFGYTWCKSCINGLLCRKKYFHCLFNNERPISWLELLAKVEVM